MKMEKIIRYFFLLLFTVGASLILGLLSFAGMYVLWPFLPAAIVTFFLSVGYEGQIYFQNIKQTFKKIAKTFKTDFFKNKLSNDYLRDNFPKDLDSSCPTFFHDYKKQLCLLHQFEHKELDDESKIRKRRVKKNLKDMEEWFATQLFSSKKKNGLKSKYKSELHEWLNQPEQARKTQALEGELFYQPVAYIGALLFSVISALFMAAGSSYLLLAVFSSVTWLASIPLGGLPIIIVPLAILAGAAYGLLIFNAVTDMIANDTLYKWYEKICKDWNDGHVLHSLIMGSVAAILAILAIIFTVCTAGTWWTVAQTSHPIFSWMSKMPTYVMGIITPIILGIGSIVFNWENTSETLKFIDEKIKQYTTVENVSTLFENIGISIKNGFENLRKRENWWQIFNPFRLFLTVTMLPLRIILFIGHIISVGVSEDRPPGISMWLAAAFGTTNEMFECGHYFFGHDHDHHAHEDKHEHVHHHECINDSDHHHDHHHEHEHEHHHHHHHHHHHDHDDHDHQSLLEERLGKGHSHSHDNDVPTIILNVIFTPIHILSAAWDLLAREWEEDPKPSISFVSAFKASWGIKEEETVSPNNMTPASLEWDKEREVLAIQHIKDRLKNVFIGDDIAKDKIQALSGLQEKVYVVKDKKEINPLIQSEVKKKIYHQQRFFLADASERTSTQNDLYKLVLHN